jgi:SNF2 family DNA or RNA helicase
MNNYDLEAGERSVWDQELAEGGGKQIADKPVKKAPRTKDPNRAAKLSSTLSAPRQLSAEVKARELSNGAIKASREAAEGARRHFFWQHRQKFAAFGAHVAPPREGLDLPGEMVAPVEQPPYIRVQMRDYQLAGLTFLAQAHAHGISAILGDEM